MDSILYLPVKVLLLAGVLILSVNCKKPTQTPPSNTKNIDSLLQMVSKHTYAFKSQPNSTIVLNKINDLSSDSLKLKYYRKMAFAIAKHQDTTLFRHVNTQALNLAHKLNDSLAIGDVHWNFGIHFLHRNLRAKSYLHYEKAYRYFKNKNEYYAAKMLYHMALIKSFVKDYTGSEILLYKAITIFKKLNKNKQLYLSHNILGTIYDNLEDYHQALSHYNKAKKYLNLLNNKSLYLQDIQNNMGVLYQKLKQHQHAIQLFNKALSYKDLKKLDPALYARIIDNRAYSNLQLKNYNNLPQHFYQSLHIRDSINHIPGLVISHLHLSEFYLQIADTAQSTTHAQIAYQLGSRLHLNRDTLKALSLLANNNPNKRAEYLLEYINIADSLTLEERKTRDKFFRIEYDTNNYIIKNKQLLKRNTSLLTIAVALILILPLLGMFFKQRARNKTLEFESKQQKADEKIYLLTIAQQTNIDKGRLQERRRISEELHDSILARLFGVRLNWESLKLIGDAQTITAHKEYLTFLQQLEREIRDVAHNMRKEIYLSDTQYVRNLQNLINKWSDRANVKIQLNVQNPSILENLNSYYKTNLYKIFEEALHNIAVHAKATFVNINLSIIQNHLNILISDNGVGFQHKFPPTGIGIKNMKSRSKKLKGTFQIKSAPQNGTQITISIPLNQ